MSLKWKKVIGGYEAVVKHGETMPGKWTTYRVAGHNFLGMKTGTYDVTRRVGFSAYPTSLAKSVGTLDAAKSVAQVDANK